MEVDYICGSLLHRLQKVVGHCRNSSKNKRMLTGAGQRGTVAGGGLSGCRGPQLAPPLHGVGDCHVIEPVVTVATVRLLLEQAVITICVSASLSPQSLQPDYNLKSSSRCHWGCSGRPDPGLRAKTRITLNPAVRRRGVPAH
jgi:hypothetical protein